MDLSSYLVHAEPVHHCTVFILLVSPVLRAANPHPNEAPLGSGSVAISLIG